MGVSLDPIMLPNLIKPHAKCALKILESARLNTTGGASSTALIAGLADLYRAGAASNHAQGRQGE